MATTDPLAGLVTAAASPLKVMEKVFEIRAIDEQARCLLETIDQINGQLEVAKDLRKQRSLSLTATEKKHMDDTFANTDRAIGHISDLVERCRIVTKTQDGSSDMRSRIMFVLRDSPRIQMTLQQLTVASQSLNMVFLLLIHRERSDDRAMVNSAVDTQPPPSYEEHNFLIERRSRNLLRKASRSSSSFSVTGPGTISASKVIPEIAEDDIDSIDWNAAFKGEKHDKDELFFEHNRSHEVGSNVYLPYRARTSSQSTTSFQSAMTANSEPPLGDMYSPILGMADNVGAQTELPRTQDLLKGSSLREVPMYATLGARRPVSSSSLESLRKNRPPSAASSAHTETTNTSDSMRPCFVVETTQDLMPQPLFRKMVKVDLADEIRLQPEELSTKMTFDPRIPLESELPEVVTPDMAPEPLPISPDTAGKMLFRARSKRYIDVESRQKRKALKALAAGETPPNLTESTPDVDVSQDKKELPPLPASHSHQSSDASSIRTLPSLSNPAVGRARSRKWQELQFEKSENLAKAT